MSIAANQQRTLLRLLAHLQPHWRRDAALPARIHTLLARTREFGSRDRRLYRELIYTALRALPWIEPRLADAPAEAARLIAWLAADTPATRAFKAEFAVGDAPDGPATDLLPAWFEPHCPALFAPDEATAMLRRAPLWLRIRTPDTAVPAAEFAARGWPARPADILASAWQLPPDADVAKSAALAAGTVEIQDLGSQLLLAAVGVEPGGTWLDACAGAGGKTLQLAELLGPSGTIHAHDVRASALEELVLRADRAGLSVSHHRGIAARIRIRAAPPSPDELFDGVLVDAPCSGSGTWRRAPHLKWVTTAESVAAAAATQRRLLAAFAAHVKPGGRLVYATCSLSREENEAVVADFLAGHPDFAPVPFARTFGFAAAAGGLTILPARHDTDGFFVASLRRRAAA